jgi:hypothetical protein
MEKARLSPIRTVSLAALPPPRPRCSFASRFHRSLKTFWEAWLLTVSDSS